MQNITLNQIDKNTIVYELSKELTPSCHPPAAATPDIAPPVTRSFTHRYGSALHNSASQILPLPGQQ